MKDSAFCCRFSSLQRTLTSRHQCIVGVAFFKKLFKTEFHRTVSLDLNMTIRNAPQQIIRYQTNNKSNFIIQKILCPLHVHLLLYCLWGSIESDRNLTRSASEIYANSISITPMSELICVHTESIIFTQREQSCNDHRCNDYGYNQCKSYSPSRITVYTTLMKCTFTAMLD